MSLQKAIWQWVQLQPGWQSDLVRRLYAQQALSEQDLVQVKRMLLEEHGLSDPTQLAPAPVRVTLGQIPKDGEVAGSTRILALRDLTGVGAVQPNQQLVFAADGLTIVYGQNGAGKSSYARVLKHACRPTDEKSRIRSNVFESVSVEGQAVIEYREGGETKTLTRNVNAPPEEALSTVRVFDSLAAQLYATEANEVAYVPVGLSIFGRLAAAQNAIRALIQTDIDKRIQVRLSLAGFDPKTAVYTLLSSLSDKTKPDEVKNLGTLTTNEAADLTTLSKSVSEMQRANTDAQELQRRINEVKALKERLVGVATELGNDSVTKLELVDQSAKTAIEAERLASAGAFGDEPLSGVGSNPWVQLWRAAREYSVNQAYPGKEFPVIEPGARCVLCQQALSEDAMDRLSRFEEYVMATAAAQARTARAKRKELADRFAQVPLNGIVNLPVRQYLRETAADTADQIDAFLDGAAVRMNKVLAALENGDWTSIPALVAVPLAAMDGWLADQEKKVQSLKSLSLPEEQEKASRRLAELRVRQELQKRLPEVLEHIQRLKEVAVLETAAKKLATNSITTKLNEMSEQVVTEELRACLARELKALSGDYVRVRMGSKGARGKSLIYLSLATAEGNEKVPVSEVLSEGEQRAVALAFFLAETAAAPHDATILLDDPVSSLDHLLRKDVAMRLVMEAKRRQVIVFTHDLQFLFSLSRASEESDVSCTIRSIRSQAGLVGLAEPDEPWIAKSVKSRSGQLRNELVGLRKSYKSGDKEYPTGVKSWCGRLREAWERLVEERLLNGTIQRFDPAVQTQRLEKIKNRVTPENVDAITVGMSETSKWVHDLAAAEDPEPPTPTELEEMLDRFDAMVKKLPVNVPARGVNSVDR